jgi:drug/metabolite transporter (DMT)-like permease
MLWLLAIAVSATLGQLALTRGLALAPASRMGAFGYFAVIFGAAYGWLLWHEPVTPALVTGSLLIAVAGLLAGRSARMPRRARTKPAVAATSSHG